MILSMGMDQKMSLDEAQKTPDSLSQSRMLPAYKMQHNLQLLGLPTTGVPAPEANVVEIAAPFPDLVEDSGLKLITSEKEEIDKASEAADWQRAIGILETNCIRFLCLTYHEYSRPATGHRHDCLLGVREPGQRRDRRRARPAGARSRPDVPVTVGQQDDGLHPTAHRTAC
jgi:hypothetical protein